MELRQLNIQTKKFKMKKASASILPYTMYKCQLAIEYRPTWESQNCKTSEEDLNDLDAGKYF